MYITTAEPGNYHNHKPTSGYDQKTITIMHQLEYQTNKRSPGNYHNHRSNRIALK